MFPTQGFTEIVFCAVTSNEQVKVSALAPAPVCTEGKPQSPVPLSVTGQFLPAPQGGGCPLVTVLRKHFRVPKPVMLLFSFFKGLFILYYLFILYREGE